MLRPAYSKLSTIPPYSSWTSFLLKLMALRVNNLTKINRVKGAVSPIYNGLQAVLLDRSWLKHKEVAI
jgi:hypothetical protein